MTLCDRLHEVSCGSLGQRWLRYGTAVADDMDRLWLDSMPTAYDRWLVPSVFRPFAVDLARRAGRLRPHRILELAAGTGVLTRELIRAMPEVEVTATDLNIAMVDFGSARVAASWQQANAMSLPFIDGWFDLVVCQFGVMFFPDKPAAFAETRRVLAPGGRFLFNTWDMLKTHGFQQALVASLQKVFPEDPPTFIVTTPHGYADVAIVAANLTAGGLEQISSQSVTLHGRAKSAADIAEGYCTGTPLRMEIETRAELEATTAAIKHQMTAQLGPGAVTAAMTAHVFESRRPTN